MRSREPHCQLNVRNDPAMLETPYLPFSLT
jgi:hypothetical protein